MAGTIHNPVTATPGKTRKPPPTSPEFMAAVANKGPGAAATLRRETARVGAKEEAKGRKDTKADILQDTVSARRESFGREAGLDAFAAQTGAATSASSGMNVSESETRRSLGRSEAARGGLGDVSSGLGRVSGQMAATGQAAQDIGGAGNVIGTQGFDIGAQGAEFGQAGAAGVRAATVQGGQDFVEQIGIQASDRNAQQAQIAAMQQAAGQSRGQAQSALGMVGSAAQGLAPSAAELQGRQQLQQAQASQFALAAGGRGSGQAAGMRQAAMGTQQLQQGAMQNAAILRAQEQEAARGQLLQGTQALRAGDVSQGAAVGGLLGNVRAGSLQAAGLTTDQTQMQVGAQTAAGELTLAGNQQALQGNTQALAGNQQALQGNQQRLQAGAAQASVIAQQGQLALDISAAERADAGVQLQQAGLTLEDAKRLDDFELSKLGLTRDALALVGQEGQHRSDQATAQLVSHRNYSVGAKQAAAANAASRRQMVAGIVASGATVAQSAIESGAMM